MVLIDVKLGEPIRFNEKESLSAWIKLKDDEQIALSAHVLRHTFLRKMTKNHGVHYAMEASERSLSRYI